MHIGRVQAFNDQILLDVLVNLFDFIVQIYINKHSNIENKDKFNFRQKLSERFFIK